MGGFGSADDLAAALGPSAESLGTLTDRLIFLPLLPATVAVAEIAGRRRAAPGTVGVRSAQARFVPGSGSAGGVDPGPADTSADPTSTALEPAAPVTPAPPAKKASRSRTPTRRNRAEPRPKPWQTGSRSQTAEGIIWALMPILMFGTSTWAVFLYAAIRRRSAALAAAAAAYGIALVAAIAYGGSAPQDSPRATAFGFALIFLGLGGADHAFAIRRSVFDGSRIGSAWRRTAASPRRVASDPQRAALEEWEQAQKDRARAREICERDPQQALELFIGRPDLPASCRAFAEGGLVDVNNVPASRLTTTLGIRRPVAERIVTARAKINGFDSIDDLSVALDLPPKLFDTVAHRLGFCRSSRPIRAPTDRGQELVIQHRRHVLARATRD